MGKPKPETQEVLIPAGATAHSVFCACCRSLVGFIVGTSPNDAIVNAIKQYGTHCPWCCRPSTSDESTKQRSLRFCEEYAAAHGGCMFVNTLPGV